ncbi:cyclodeaminase [Sediminibacillus albus]|uniref:Ornithine cyclodeaminase n=1 Tax=Sediminibacillus albus TaxID=407036 RepID=A0A1G8WQW5_9BACI|nr:cyclodeaminase [Sediminibacillus albus]SDJ80447.1 ornithine cyclodeaminase [Sediminibacillus albus]
MILFTESEIRQYVQLQPQVLTTIEKGFSSLQDSQVVMPPIMRIDFPESNGEIDIKSAYVKGVDKFAVKMSTGFFDNHLQGLPSGNGMMLLFSSETGVPRAVMLDNGYLTHLRTAAAGAIAASYLSQETVDTVGVIGTGSQARCQIEALHFVRSFTRLLVFGRNQEHVKTYIDDVSGIFQGEIVACSTAEQVVRQSELVISTTPSETPVIKADWIHPGLHITAMGADAEHKNELEVQCFQAADKIVCDSKQQCLRLGELHHAYASGMMTDDSEVSELGAIISGQESGRLNESEITICDLTGTGVQDTMIAVYAYDALVKHRAGTTF